MLTKALAQTARNSAEHRTRNSGSGRNVHPPTTRVEKGKRTKDQSDTPSKRRINGMASSSCITSDKANTSLGNPTTSSYMDRRKGGFCHSPNGDWHVWRLTFSTAIRASILTDKNPAGFLTINTLELAAYIAHLHLFAPRMAPLEHISTGVNNTAAESWALESHIYQCMLSSNPLTPPFHSQRPGGCPSCHPE